MDTEIAIAVAVAVVLLLGIGYAVQARFLDPLIVRRLRDREGRARLDDAGWARAADRVFGLAAAGRVSEAIEVARAQAGKRPSDPYRWLTLFEVLREADRHGEAIEALREGYRRNPASLEIGPSLVDVLWWDHPDEAVAVCEELAASHPDQAAADVYLVFAEGRRGRDRAALDAADRAEAKLETTRERGLETARLARALMGFPGQEERCERLLRLAFEAGFSGAAVYLGVWLDDHGDGHAAEWFARARAIFEPAQFDGWRAEAEEWIQFTRGADRD